ncbi:hypothetical protein BDZ85DRAFT_249410 [Elsinoe ampelina]|uniref:LysM domain-containing protein n=1 Tax=Elsinoe ampelina TaxID=302913 RepID=A0A6A6GCL9_9PEZI|nr:hypothetical protein BDZ85DRAFT_249410 [Elsinoe ampelina]
MSNSRRSSYLTVLLGLLSGCLAQANDPRCTWKTTAGRGATCQSIASEWLISVEEFISWNPAVGVGCVDGVQTGSEYCVEWTGALPSNPTSSVSSTTSSASSTTSSTTIVRPPTTTILITSTTNSRTTLITTTLAPPTTTSSTPSGPSPTQPGLITACKTFHKVVSGDTCQILVDKYRTFSLADFYKWNPDVGSSCASLFLDYYVCIGISGGNGGITPLPPPPAVSPTMENVNKNCATFHKVVSGDQCQALANEYNVPLSAFLSWNPPINSACTNLWLDYFVCVGSSVLGGFFDAYGGMDSITSISAFELVPSNTANPLRISGRVLGANAYPENTWVDWLNTVECQTATSPRRFSHDCATAAFVSGVSSAIQAVANDPAKVYGMNVAETNVIGPFYPRKNQRNAYTEDHIQGKSCTDCPGPANPRVTTSWKGSFLPAGTEYYLKSRRIKVTCKKACGAKDVNVQNLENVLPLVPAKIREMKGAGANFYVWRAATREVVGRCRVTYVQGIWFDRVDGGVDQVYGGEEAEQMANVELRNQRIQHHSHRRVSAAVGSLCCFHALNVPPSHHVSINGVDDPGDVQIARKARLVFEVHPTHSPKADQVQFFKVDEVAQIMIFIAGPILVLFVVARESQTLDATVVFLEMDQFRRADGDHVGVEIDPDIPRVFRMSSLCACLKRWRGCGSRMQLLASYRRINRF